MARMKPTGAVSIDYQETRTLGMLSDRWKGSGVFYAILPDTLIKAQKAPEQEIMGMKGSHLYYYHPGNNQKHQAELEDDEAMSFQVSTFKGLMNGDLAFLKAHYQLAFKATTSGWQLSLISKTPDTDSTAAQVIMRGLPNKAANKLELLLKDGDRTEYALTPALQGQAAKAQAQQVLSVLEAP